VIEPPQGDRHLEDFEEVETDSLKGIEALTGNQDEETK
jgi:hypothetical protein